MSLVQLKVKIPNDLGIVTLSIETTKAISDLKFTMNVNNKFPGFNIHDYVFFHAPSSKLFEDESITLAEAVASANCKTHELFELEFKLDTRKPAAAAANEARKSGAPVQLQEIKVNLEELSTTFTISPDSTLNSVIKKALLKFSKSSDRYSQTAFKNYRLIATKSNQVYPNSAVPLQDVLILENVSSGQIEFSLKPLSELPEVNSMVTNPVPTNYVAGMLNYHKGKPTKTARMRWFILDEFQIAYYRYSEDQVPKKVFLITTEAKFDIDHQNTSPQSPFSYFLTMKIPGEEVLTFGCATEDERGQWMRALEYARLAHLRFVLEQSAAYLNENSLQVKGLFRANAAEPEVTALKQKFAGGNVAFSLSGTDSHVVANCLKLHFAEVPEPLMTFNLYQKFLATQAIADEDQRASALGVALTLLPQMNAILINYLFAFIARVSAYSKQNDMSIEALSEIFTPVLIAKKAETQQELIATTGTRQQLIQSLVTDYAFYFTVPIVDPNEHRLEKDDEIPKPPAPQVREGFRAKQSVVGPSNPSAPMPPSSSSASSSSSSPTTTATSSPSPSSASSSSSEAPPNPLGLPLGKALFDFEPVDPNQLKFRKGDWILIHKRNPTGWWLGESNGEKGLFPYNYVQLDEQKALAAAPPPGKVIPPSRSQAASIAAGSSGISMPPPSGLGASVSRTVMAQPALYSTPAPSAMDVGLKFTPAEEQMAASRFEEEIGDRKRAEDARASLTNLLEEAKKVVAAEQRTRIELNKRLVVVQEHAKELTDKAELLRKEREEASKVKYCFEQSCQSLKLDNANLTKSREKLQEERKSISASSIQLLQQPSNQQVKTSIQSIVSSSSTSVDYNERIAFEEGKRLKFEEDCVALQAQVDELYRHALEKTSDASRKQDLTSKHEARAQKQLQAAKAASAALLRLQQILQEELADVKNSILS